MVPALRHNQPMPAQATAVLKIEYLLFILYYNSLRYFTFCRTQIMSLDPADVAFRRNAATLGLLFN